MKSILSLIGLLVLAPVGGGAAESPARRPNILHLHTDDHRADGLHALGNPEMQTPNLDALVARGMTFRNCYTMGSMVGAVCTPSRTMMLTGRSWLRLPKSPGAAPHAADPATFLPRVLEAAGYQTWHMGKYGNGFPAGLQSFQSTIQDEGKDAGPDKDRAFAPQRLADRSIQFLKDRTAAGETRPFYLYLAPPVPHDPRIAEPRFHQLYEADKLPLPPAFLPQHPFNNGEMMVRDEQLAPWPRTPENTRQQLAEYYACITGFDFHVGRLFEALKAGGQWENTIIIFSGDNGLSMGEHGLFGKQNLYEFGGMHVPLVIAGPGIPQGSSAALVYLMDLFPTLVEFGKATLPEAVEGRSLVPVIEGKTTGVREVLYTAYRNCQRAIRDGRWKLILYPLVNQTQLFDLESDARELHNLAGQPEQAARIASLTARLEQEMAAYGDNAPLKSEHPQPAEWTPPTRKEPADAGK
jgi:arylsulfatase A-like enzyme